MTDFTPTTTLLGNRWKDDLDPLWLLTPEELAALSAAGEANVESILGERLALADGPMDGFQLTDVRDFRFGGPGEEPIRLSLTSWGVRGSELSRLNANPAGGGRRDGEGAAL